MINELAEGRGGERERKKWCMLDDKKDKLIVILHAFR